ncbi:hypothetical protein F5144DRAFT_594788 [Chaetomium tenue]|uniref:Uncharacterized protein n=1 Tax=Chaetomium tenue TaxID=1854479 RepID=A0ACB7P6P2_9PEZI|nr:hypothetical protein F5144DRAFT_594788 [Chaetomium globosum]
MDVPEAQSPGYAPSETMSQNPTSRASNLDDLLEHCKETGADVQITSDGPGQSSGRRFTVQGGGKYAVVEENILASTLRGRELLRSYGWCQWSLMDFACSWFICVGGSYTVCRPRRSPAGGGQQPTA